MWSRGLSRFRCGLTSCHPSLTLTLTLTLTQDEVSILSEKESRLRQQLKHSHQSTQDLEASLLASRHGQRKEDRERIESLEAQLHDKDREVMRLRKSLFFLIL